MDGVIVRERKIRLNFRYSGRLACPDLENGARSVRGTFPDRRESRGEARNVSVESRKSSGFFKRPRERQRSGKKGRADIGVENVGGTFDAVFFSTFFSAVEKQHHGDAGATVFALANRFPGGQASLWPGDTDCQSICPSRWSLIRQQC